MLSLERGGGESFDLEIARHLQLLGGEISFLSGIPLFGKGRIPNPTSRFKCPAPVYQLRSPYFGWFPWDKTKGGWRLRVLDFKMFESRAAQWAARHAREFDIIQVCELPHFVAQVKRKGVETPVVMRLTAPNFYDPCDGVSRADAVIASGETLASVREKVRPDCYDIPNSVDTDLFRPHASTFRAVRGMAPNAYVVLYVARFQDFKNHNLLVESFAKLRTSISSAWLVLVGKGPLKSLVQKRVRELGLANHVLFMGEQPFEKLPDIYAAADVLAISSDFESFCFAALEAMATELPIVTTDCGWVPKLLGTEMPQAEGSNKEPGKGAWREGGIVVPLRDADALAQALKVLHERPEVRHRMGMRNRRAAVESHGWQSSAQKLMRVYNQLLEK